MERNKIEMRPVTYFGFKCLKKDEKSLVQGVNNYLSTLNRTMSKAKNPSLLKARLPFVYKHYYWNHNKGVGTYFEIFPNEDDEGKFYSTAHKEYAWIIVMRIDLTHPEYRQDKTESFLQEVLEAAGFETIMIKEMDNED